MLDDIRLKLTYHVKIRYAEHINITNKSVIYHHNSMIHLFLNSLPGTFTLMNKSFTFKQFEVQDFQCGMPVSTDGVLLGAWANLNKSQSVLDIGSGTGLLSLMCAQRAQTIKINAIEIDLLAAQASQENVKNSPWFERINVHHCSIQNYIKTNNKFDTIICNPPYFNHGEQAKVHNRALARHTSTLSFSDLLISTKQLLKDQGKASFILPKFESTEFIALAVALGFQLSRLTYVKTTLKKHISRAMMEFTLQEQPIYCDETLLVINEMNGYSNEFIELTRDFYLKM